MVSTAAFHARVRGYVPGLGGLKETKLLLPHPRVKVSIVGSLRDREVACSASDRQGSNFESCVWRTVSSQSSHHPQEVLLAQFSQYVHKGGLKPDSFHFLVTKAPRFSRSGPILKRLHWLPVKSRIHFKICAITFRTLKENQPAYLADLLVRPKCSKYLRSANSNRFVVPRIKTKTGSRAFSISGPALWNALPVPIRNAKTILTFRKLLKSHLFDLAFPP